MKRRNFLAMIGLAPVVAACDVGQADANIDVNAEIARFVEEHVQWLSGGNDDWYFDTAKPTFGNLNDY